MKEGRREEGRKEDDFRGSSSSDGAFPEDEPSGYDVSLTR